MESLKVPDTETFEDSTQEPQKGASTLAGTDYSRLGLLGMQNALRLFSARGLKNQRPIRTRSRMNSMSTWTTCSFLTDGLVPIVEADARRPVGMLCVFYARSGRQTNLTTSEKKATPQGRSPVV